MSRRNKHNQRARAAARTCEKSKLFVPPEEPAAPAPARKKAKKKAKKKAA